MCDFVLQEIINRPLFPCCLQSGHLLSAFLTPQPLIGMIMVAVLSQNVIRV